MNRQPGASYRPWKYSNMRSPRVIQRGCVEYSGQVKSGAWKGIFILVTPLVIKPQCVTHSSGVCTSLMLTSCVLPLEWKPFKGNIAVLKSPHIPPEVHIHHPCRGPSHHSNTWSRAPFLQTSIQSLHASLEVDLEPWNVHTRSVTVVTRTAPSSLIFRFLSDFHDFKGACSVLTHTHCSAWAWFSFSALIVRRHFICIMEGYANLLWWLIWLFKILAYWCAKGASYFCFKVRVCSLRIAEGKQKNQTKNVNTVILVCATWQAFFLKVVWYLKVTWSGKKVLIKQQNNLKQVLATVFS